MQSGAGQAYLAAQPWNKYREQVEGTIFRKIIRKEIPAKVLHDDEHCIAFHDVNSQVPTHFFVIPRVSILMIQDVKEDD